MGRLDRWGEVIDDDPGPDDEHPGCTDGWLGEDADGRLIPCGLCRPHLAPLHAELRRRLEGPRP
jgi:hypothetical protein